MSKKRGTSNAPIVLGIVGGVLGLPAALCSGACAAAVESMDEVAAAGITEFYLYGALIVSFLLIVISCFTKKFPMVSGLLMLVCTIAGFVLFIVTMNILGIIAMVLTLIGSILALVQKKEIIE